MTRWEFDDRIVLSNERIEPADGERQGVTAREICRRLEHQPGVVLADDVGMGKTFVALAVAASTVRGNPGRQVVIMVPSAVADKWPSDWTVFQEHCLGGDTSIRATTNTVRRGSEFLKLLDDDLADRKHIIFLTHGALRSNLDDPFVKLAVIRAAFRYQRRLTAQRRQFPRWAARVLRRSDFTAERVEALLAAPPRDWRRIWDRLTDQVLDDDPVPLAICEALDELDLEAVRTALGEIPLRSSPYLDDRLRTVRSALAASLQTVWHDAVRKVRAHLPLLIFDEAHHVKNPNKLRSLFDSGDGETAESVRGAFAGVFEKMVLLTATPFQLGHRELLSVLRLFDSVRMTRADRDQFELDLITLGHTLDIAQANAVTLDRMWARLEPDDLTELPDRWWSDVTSERADHVDRVAQSVQTSVGTLGAAARQLRPWVIRHTKTRERIELPGVATLPGTDMTKTGGLPIERSSVLPFLLAARAQAYVAFRGLQEHRSVTTLFADGLASSFEAYVATRTPSTDLTDEAEDRLDNIGGEDIQWYLDRIGDALPKTGADTWAEHPKVHATIARAMFHWERSEKVLVFCFYRATGRALRRHISTAMEQNILVTARDKLQKARATDAEVFDALNRRADSLLRRDSLGARQLADKVTQLGKGAQLADDNAQTLAEVVLRFMRTPSFLVRYVDDLLGSDTGAALASVLDVADGSGLTLTQRLADFAARVSILTPTETTDLWGALESIQTGARRADETDWFSTSEIDADGVRLLPNVHLANGSTQRELRKRLMLTFNTPFLPEVLIASSVMAEGVDLHRECRHVIHHDLDWNPSTLEQRTGRVDRLGSKASLTGQKIIVCEPYVGGTQDEKQFVVVKDRERWFSVVMGGRVPTGELETAQIAARVSLPDELLEELTLDLSVWHPTDPIGRVSPSP